MRAPAPARRVVTGRRTGSLTGHHPSRKMGATISFESLLESDGIAVLETDPDVVAYWTQPETMTWREPDGRVRRYTPDVLVQMRSRREYREIKPATRLRRDPSLAGRRGRIEAECRARGATHVVWTDADIRREPRLSNARAIIAARRTPIRSPADERLLACAGAASTVAELARVSGVPVEAALRGAIRLAAHGRLVLDLEGTLGPTTSILRRTA